jgi:NADH:ubiquinone oxidoreductase subunit 6 (subunit J)
MLTLQILFWLSVVMLLVGIAGYVKTEDDKWSVVWLTGVAGILALVMILGVLSTQPTEKNKLDEQNKLNACMITCNGQYEYNGNRCLCLNACIPKVEKE